MPISVVIPNFNHGKWLNQCIEAITVQDEPAHEIIVVDDASTDDSVEVVERLQKRWANIQLVRHEANRGVVGAFASGVARATGNLITFPAADDRILPNLFSRATAALSNNPRAAFFCSEVVLINERNEILGFRPPVPPTWRAAYLSPEEVRSRSHRSDNWFVGQSVVYRRDMYDTVGHDATLGSLTDALANRLLAFRYGFYYDPEVLAAWRVYPQSYSARSSLSREQSKLLLEAARVWGETHYPPDVRETYIPSFDRRARFSMARLHIVWAKDKIDWQSIAELARWRGIDRALARAFVATPRIGKWLLLAWLTVRLQPSSFFATTASFLRSAVLNFSRHQKVERALSQVVCQE